MRIVVECDQQATVLIYPLFWKNKQTKVEWHPNYLKHRLQGHNIYTTNTEGSLYRSLFFIVYLVCEAQQLDNPPGSNLFIHPKIESNTNRNSNINSTI